MKLVDRILRRFGYAPLATRNGGFYGAQQSRLTSDWLTMASGPNAELYSAIRTLRDRARDLEKNNALAKRYIRLVGENVAGPRGLTLQCRNTLPSGEANNQANTAIEAAFATWGEPGTYSVDGRLGRAAFERMTIENVARDGEAFVRKVRSTDYGFGLQLIDPALVDEQKNEVLANGHVIKLGVEMDRWGKPVAYHVLKYHPYDLTESRGRETERIPATEMHHLFIPTRPGQVRGYTWLSPVMFLLKMADGYVEAHTVQARAGSLKMGFIENDPQFATASPDPEVQREWEAAAGVIEELLPGQKFTPWDPSVPSQNFELFMTQIGRYIASGLGVAYPSLTGDTANVNYTSWRIASNIEKDSWRSLQGWFAESFCEPVFRDWIEVAWLKGYVPLRMPPSRYRDHVWQPRGWAYTNPREEMVANLLAIAGKLRSPQEIVGEQGGDLEDVYRMIAEARNLAEKYDLPEYVPNSLMEETDGADDTGSTDAGSGDGTAEPGDDGGTGTAGGGRAHPRFAVL